MGWAHVLMYAYYFLAATLPKDPAVRKRWLFWGKYLTMFQMAQFAANFAQGIYVYTSNSYHRGISALLVGYMASLLLLRTLLRAEAHRRRRQGEEGGEEGCMSSSGR